MNKIYKLIWSKVKNMWVAVAEIAKSHTKSSRSSVIGRTLVAGVLACVLGFGVAGPVLAAGNANDINSSNDRTVTGADVYEWLNKYGLYGASMIGTGSEPISSYASIGIGSGARVGAVSNNSVGYSLAIGNSALTTGSYSASIGSNAIAYGYRSVAIGAGAQALTVDAFANENSGKSRAVAIGAGSKALANLSVAIGDNAVAEAGKAWVVSIGANSYSGLLGSYASGYGAKSYGKNAVALRREAYTGQNSSGKIRSGAGSTATSVENVGTNAVAIGYLSAATEDNAMAFGYKTEATGINAIALGSGTANTDEDFTNSITRASGQNSMAFGFNARAASQNSIVFGGNALTGENADSSIAIGYDSQVTGEKSIAIGLGHRVLGNNSGTFGDPNIVNGDNSYVVGNNSTVAENTSNVFVLGNNVNTIGSNTVVLGGSTDSANKLAVTGSNSVVLGVGSDGSQSNVVSVGNSTSKRKVVNVADGASATDAATVGQVRTVSEGNGIVLTETTNTNGSKNESIAVKAGTNVTVDTNGVNVIGNGAVASADTGLISGGTAYSELRPIANGNYIATANTSAQNLGALDSALKTADNTAIKNITASGTTVTFTKGDGTTGTFTTQDNNTEYAAGNGLELTGTEFTAKAGTNVTVDNNGINVAGNGTVADGNTGLVSGGTLFTEGRVSADAIYVKANNTIAGNLSALDTAVKTNADAITQINTGLEGKANTSLDNITNDGKAVIKTNAKEAINVKGSGKVTVDKTDVSGVDTYTVGVTVDGAVAEGNTGIVDGGAVYTALQAQKTTTDTALTGKANVALDNVTEAGHNVIKSDAKSAINAIAGTHTTISKTDVDGVDTYAVNVTTDGTVTDGNTGIVTGGTVYTAVNAEKTAREAADTVLQGNIDTEATARGNEDTRLAGLITSEESARIAADTALSEQIGTLSADGNYILKTNDVSQNLGVLDTQVKANADNLADEVTARENADTALSERIATNTNNIATNTTDITNLKDLSNITDAGKTVIKDFAKGSVNVVGSGLASVTKTNVEGVDTYTVGVVADGEVADGNAKLVNGGVVHTAIQNAVSDLNTDVQTALAGKANVALDNVTVAGHNVIKTDAKSAVNVTGNSDVTVTKTDVDGVDTYNVAVVKTGTVADGNEGVVTGGTVYDALTAETRPAADGNYIAADHMAGANLTALDTQVKTNADAIAVNTTDITNLKDLSNITDAGQTVVKNLAKGSVNVVGTNKATVTKTDVNGVDTYTVDVKADAGKANVELDNVAAAGHAVIKMDAKSAINVTGGTNAEVVKTDVNGVDTYTVNVAGNGQVVENDTGLMNGGTVYTELRPTDGNYVRKDATTAANLSALDTKIGTVTNGDFVRSTNTVGQNLNALDEALYDKANWDASNVGRNTVVTDDDYPVGLTDEQKAEYAANLREYNLQSWGQALGAGTVKGGDSRLITGDTLHVEVRPANSGTYVKVDKTTGENLLALDEQLSSVVSGAAAQSTTITTLENEMMNKANIALDNINADGQNVVRNIAKSAVVVADGPNTTVASSTDTDGNVTYRVTANATGSVTDGNTGLVDGGAVYTAIENAKAAMGGDIGGLDADGNYIRKANTVAENLVALDTQVKTNSDGLAAEQMARETADTALGNRIGTLTADGNYIAKDSSVSENLSSLDTAVKSVRDKADSNTADITNLKDLSNITAAGETVIKDLAKGSVKVINGARTTVTEGTNGDIKTFAVNVDANGTVTDGNTGLVTGGTVKSALDALSGSLDTDLAGKANVSLDNVSGAGHAVIKSDAKSAINVVGGQYATVAKTDVNGVDTYTVNVATDGSVADGNRKLVTGGTVYNALQDVRSSVNTSLAGKANTSLDNLDVDGMGRVRDIAKSAVSVVNGMNTTVASETGANGNVVYKVNVSASGSVVSGNVGIMSGGTMYNELRPADGNYVARSNTTAANLTALDAAVKEAMTKAETAQSVTGGNAVVYDTDDRSSVTLGGTDGTAIHNVADGAVTADSKDAVTGGQLYTVKSAVDANTTAIAGLDTRVQDNTTAIDTLRTTVTNGLDGKTDTNLGNLTDAGKDAVRDLAKESVRVADGVNTTVRTTVDGDASVYHVDVAANGRVESGNTGIVTGDAVYEAIRDIEINASDTHYVSINPSEKDDETFANHGASGADAVAIGAKSYASGDESVAIGHNNDVSGNETYVIGSDIDATGNNSVVLGKGSDGSLDNVVSVGSAGNERRIVHVADGELSADSKDAVNGKQLYEVREKLQNAEGIDVDKWSDALGAGSVAPDDERLVKGSTVYSAIQSTGISLSPDGSTMNVGAANNATVVDFTNSEGNGRVLQGIVTDPGNPNSAANVGYVNAIGQNIVNGVNSGLNRLDTKINKVGAGAAALASLAPMPFDDDQKWSVSAAIGTYHGTQAGAVGVFYKPQDNVMLNIRGAIGNGENMGGAGLSIGLNKGAAKGLSKASMAKAMNAQANEIVAQKQLIENQQAQLDAQKAEIEELKQMVRSVVASKQVDK